MCTFCSVAIQHPCLPSISSLHSWQPLLIFQLLDQGKWVKVFTGDTSHALGPRSALPTGNLKTYWSWHCQMKSHDKSYSTSLSAQFSIVVRNTTLSWTSQLGTPELFSSHRCLSHSPHPVCYQLLPLFFFFFLVNISWIHPLPFHSHNCGLSLVFGLSPLGICRLLASLPSQEQIKPQLHLTVLVNFLFSVCIFNQSIIVFGLHWDCWLLSGLCSNAPFLCLASSANYLLIVPILFLYFTK